MKEENTHIYYSVQSLVLKGLYINLLNWVYVHACVCVWGGGFRANKRRLRGENYKNLLEYTSLSIVEEVGYKA